MSSSRYLNPSTPGGLLSPSDGNELTADEELVVQAITAGTYFQDPAIPTGTINGINVTFTLPSNPNPDTSLLVLLNGLIQTLTADYSISGTTLTFVVAPETDSVLKVWYRVSPV